MLADFRLKPGAEHLHDFTVNKKGLQCAVCGLKVKSNKSWWKKYGGYEARYRPHCLCCGLPNMKNGVVCKTCEDRNGVPIYEKGTEEVGLRY